MINILFIHSSSELYGSDRSLLNIIKNIDRTKYKVFVLLPCQGPLVDKLKEIKDVRVDIFEVAVLRRKNLSLKGGICYIRDFRRSIRYIKDYVRKYKIDIIDTNTAVVFPGAIAARKLKIKSVWHIREIIKNDFENKVISYMMNRYADLIIANSRATGEALKVKSSKLRVVYNAVEEKDDNSRRLHEQVTVGMAGRINRWKGQRLFVDMAEIVHRKYSNVLFQIAGEAYTGEEKLKAELLDYIESKNLSSCVHLLGQVEDMDSFYKGLDIFVLPSIQPEPFGLVVIEAMEYSLPIIATNHGGPTEIISDGINGFLVDYHSPREMAQRVISLVKNEKERNTIGKAGFDMKRSKFSLKTMIVGIENVFEEVIDKEKV